MDRKEARRVYVETATRHGWPLNCHCGDWFIDPQNRDYDAYCDACASYATF